MSSLFEILTEGAPVPAVAVIAFPAGSVSEGESSSEFPIYAMVHSSDTGECPSGQCELHPILYFILLGVMMIHIPNTYLHCLNPNDDHYL